MTLPAGKCEPIKLTGIILDEVGEPRKGSSLYVVPFQLSRTPSAKWTTFFLMVWDLPPRFTAMHRPGIARVIGDRVILDGTTIEEVKRFHLDTLKLAIEQANRLEEQSKQRADAAERKRTRHREHVAEVAKELKFD